MKLSFTFQTLIMAVLAPVLAAITAFWGVLVYRSVHEAILAGFDRKLLTLSSGAAAFVDGDAHVRFQQRRHVVALAPRPGAGLAGVAAALDELVAFDSIPGGARPPARVPGETYRTLAADPIPHLWLGFSSEHGSPVVLDARSMLVRRIAAEAPACPGARTSLATIEPRDGLVLRAACGVGFLDVEDPFYRRNRAAFVSLQRESGLSYLYTQVYVGHRRIYYVMDGTVGAGYSRPGAGDELPTTSVDGAESVQFLGRSWMSPIQQWAAWGLLKSVFTPIVDSAGTVIGMAGADVDITIIRQRTRWALFSVVFVGVLTLVAAGFISLAVARALTQPLRHIKNSALWIAAGYYGTKVEAPGIREIGRLAQTLNALGAHVTDEEARARRYGRELTARRRNALLQGALHGLAGTDPKAGPLAGIFDLSPEAGGVAAEGRVVLWLGATGGDALGQTCLQARASCLARKLLTAHPIAAPAAMVETLAASFPMLIAGAIWTAETGLLHVFARAPLQIAPGEPSSRRIDLAPGTTVVAVTAGDRLRWAQPGPPA